MDNYPKKFAPEFDDGGGVATPFQEWWSSVARAFPNVPGEVAEQWLHRHWGHSPYRYLPSSRYAFEKQAFAPAQIAEIQSRFVDWSYEKAIAQGKHINGCDIWLSRQFQQSKQMPIPMVLLDNRDGHLDELAEKPSYEVLPHAIIVIEGHRRHALACYFHSRGDFVTKFDAWVMRPT